MTIDEAIKELQKLAEQKSFRARSRLEFLGFNLPRYSNDERREELVGRILLDQKSAEALYSAARLIHMLSYYRGSWSWP